ncbi:MAG: SDR family oxidoreductase [FCB group bacterium]|jgi:dTDP-4-dehydrorhamnose reductase|nr:SDR family oxidoreductase [FCB group bacterium]
MSKTVLITGASGFVAGSVIDQAPEGWALHALSRSAPPVARRGLAWHSLDPLDAPSLEEAFRTIRPEAVIHTAAMADIDKCEAEKELARRVNAGFTRDLARLSVEGGARLIYVSTDNVFDGFRGQYTEEDTPGPVNFYGVTKMEGEEAVLEALPRTGVVVRTSLVMGLPVLGKGNSFLSRMMKSWEDGKPVGVPANETRTPIDIITLGQALIELVDNPVVGYLHTSGNETVNRLDMVQRIAAHLGYGADMVYANDPTVIPGRAARPLDVSLVNTRACSLLRTPMRGLLGGLELVLAYKRRSE